jgi:hypothetical protein
MSTDADPISHKMSNTIEKEAVNNSDNEQKISSTKSAENTSKKSDMKFHGNITNANTTEILPPVFAASKVQSCGDSDKNPSIAENLEASDADPNSNMDSAPKSEIDQEKNETPKSHIKNPYFKNSPPKNTSISSPLSGLATRKKDSEAVKTPSNSSIAAYQNSSGPPKRKTENINMMNSIKKKGKNEVSRISQVRLLVEGYAFHDDIIGVAHKKTTGEEAFNLTLRNMIIDKEMEEDGFNSYVTLRDKSSGILDEPLTGTNGYCKYLFLSINVHHFSNAAEASNAVIQQCQKLQTVRIFTKNELSCIFFVCEYCQLMLYYSKLFLIFQRLLVIRYTIYLVTNMNQLLLQVTRQEQNLLS